MNFEHSAAEIEALQSFARFCREELGPGPHRPAPTHPGPPLLPAERSLLLRADLARLARAGFLGLLGQDRPEQPGGAAGGLLQALPFCEELAACCPATFVAAEASVGTAAGLLRRHGNAAQRQLAHTLAQGELLAAYAAGEAGPGESDPFALQTDARADGTGWVLDGKKAMVVNAPAADLFVVLAVTDRRAGEEGFGLFVVPRATLGLSCSEPLATLGLHGALLGELVLDGCRLPAAARLGSPGDGWQQHARATTAAAIRYAALALGISRACLELALPRSLERRGGAAPPFANQEVSFKLADMQVMIDASMQLTRYAAWLHDRQDREAPVLASCAKLHAGESASRIAHAALQIFGGDGYLEGSRIAQLYRDARFCELGQGTSEVHRAAIAGRELARHGREDRPRAFVESRTSRRKVMPRKLEKRVAICAVAQTPYVRENTRQRFQGMALDVLESLLQQTGLDFSAQGGISTTISVSDDVFDARTISNNAMTDVLGAHYRGEEKVAQNGAQAIYYGVATILSGHADLVLVIGHCKESQAASRNMVTHLAFDPFYTRPVGLDFRAAAALQAQAYLARSKVTAEQLARLVVRARERAARNPLTASLERVTEQDVLSSPLLADPIRLLHEYPVSDGAVGLILASEERARSLTTDPVWVSGVGCCFDSFFLGDRDLATSFALRKATQRACQRAGITDPGGAFDLVELSDQYAYQLPLWAEGLGLCPEGEGGRWLAENGPEKCRVNPSGGMLAGNPLILGGLVRVAEAALQLAGRAGARQVPGAATALAHGVMGPAGQFHSVVTLQRG
ncbi:MAG: hypothetical protein FJ125_00945 [Deltaproteobacteria bacterium]|nr:hypothetical protein [Deltaproteobacteria bacterium]